MKINTVKRFAESDIGAHSQQLRHLPGDRAGQYSIRRNGQWRICFSEYGGDFYNVEIVDYH